MKRRNFITSVGATGSALLVGASGVTQASEALDMPSPDASLVGSLDLSQIGVIDTHVHPPHPMTLSESYDKWNSSFVNSMLPSYEYEGKDALRLKLSEDFKKHLYNMPRQTGYYNYVARAYDVGPDISSFNQVVTEGIKSGFGQYVEKILDRENITGMVLQSQDLKPQRPESAVPDDRFAWSYPIVDFIQPEWATENGLGSLKEVSQKITDIMSECVTNGCVGFKSNVAYYRPLVVDPVDQATAIRAFNNMLKNPPDQYKNVPGRGVISMKVADYQEPELKTAFRSYQDYLLKHIFIKAGELKVPMIIHTAVGLHPALKFEYNSPLELPRVLLDDDILRAETQFVLIHTGYPYYQQVAAMLSQFPNLFTDLSFYSKFPGVIEETLRAFLALAPSEKVMHGSDSNNVPEEMGYCAWNTRHVLAKVLRDYKNNYGWTQRDCEKIANNVLHENARRVFKI